MSLFAFLIIGAGIGVLGMPNTEVSIRKNSLVRSSVDDSITKTREEVKTLEIAKEIATPEHCSSKKVSKTRSENASQGNIGASAGKHP